MKLLFALLLASATLTASAQTKKAPTKTSTAPSQSALLLGLGQFKINKTTTAVVAELCKELNTKLQYANSREALPDGTDSVGVYALEYRQLEDESQVIDQAQACAASKVYYITNYEVANLPIHGLYLTFYNNLLVKIELPDPGRFPEAFSIKYGKPVDKHITKPTTCVYTYTGNKITYKDETLYQTWRNNSISAVNTIVKYYDSHCEKQFASRLVIQDEAKYLQLAKCSLAVAGAAEAKKINSAKKGLSDL